MEFRSSPREGGRAAEVVVSGPDGAVLADVALLGGRVTVGRLPGVNDIALQPDPKLLVTRAGHCTFELEGAQWFVVDGGSVNGTSLRRGGALQRVTERTALHDGDVVCVLAAITETDERRFFELAFHASADSQATRAAPAGATPASQVPDCLSYDPSEAASWDSRRNRARNSSLSASSGAITFSATLRASRSWVARKTVPIPPRPSTDSIV